MGSRRAATAAVADRRGALAAIRRESIWGWVSGQLAVGVSINSVADLVERGELGRTRERPALGIDRGRNVGCLKLSLTAPT